MQYEKEEEGWNEQDGRARTFLFFFSCERVFVFLRERFCFAPVVVSVLISADDPNEGR